jgi:hypothetical protein
MVVVMMRRFEGLDIDTRAVGRGALVGLAVIAPVSIAIEVLDAVDLLSKGSWVFVPAVAIVAGFFLAGFRAAHAARSAPYSHGALAGLATLAVWLVLRTVTHALLGERMIGKAGDSIVTIVAALLTGALLAMSFGIMGGLLAARAQERHPR